ncbi:hypothetical protein LguiA_011394 [Lonicera macranthoides]
MWQKLDRVMCNKEWLDHFSDAKVLQLNRQESDHSPLLAQFSSSIEPRGCFKFQNMWVKHFQFKLVVERCWKAPLVGDPLYTFAGKLKRLKKSLVKWNKNQFGRVDQNIIDAENAILDAELKLTVDDALEAREQLDLASARLN